MSSPTPARAVAHAAPADPLLRVRGLTVRYGEHAAVTDASFDIAAGQRVALVGESGSGKTTLGLALAGFLTAQDAHVRADAIDLGGRDVRPGRRRVLPTRTEGTAFVLQDAMTSLDPVWSVGSQLRAVIRANHGVTRRAADALAAEWLQRVGLSDTGRVLGARPGQLSGGMRQRVMLAIALSGNPRLLIADEPTSALDAALSRATMELLASLSAETGVALLIVSHDIRMCLEFSDRIMVMYRGELVEQGPTAQLVAHASHPYTRGLLACAPTLDSAGTAHLPTLRDFGVHPVAA